LQALWHLWDGFGLVSQTASYKLDRVNGQKRSRFWDRLIDLPLLFVTVLSIVLFFSSIESEFAYIGMVKTTS
jgi:hypothetical protein